jgi:nucleoside-diphosphate-sugar epimerase
MDKLGSYSSNQAKAVAIVGASGYIGRHLVEELQRLGGFRIKLLTRSLDNHLRSARSDMDMEVFEGDLREPESLQDFLECGCTVINLAYLWGAGEAANLEVTQNLLEACKVVKVKRLIHCSTAAVIGRVLDNLITEATPCRPVTEYGMTKLSVEQSILDAGKGNFDVVVLRPTSVFGPEGEPLKKLARDIVSGSRLSNYLKSSLFGKRRMNLVPVENVVGAIILLMCHVENFDGEVFIVSDDDSPTNNFADVEKFLMRELQIAEYMIPRIPLPLGLLEILLGVMGRNNINPRCNYVSSKLRNFGFEGVMTFDAALAKYATWYSSSRLDR